MNINKFIRLENSIFKNKNTNEVYYIGINNILYYNNEPVIKFKNYKTAGLYLHNILKG